MPSSSKRPKSDSNKYDSDDDDDGQDEDDDDYTYKKKTNNTPQRTIYRTKWTKHKGLGLMVEAISNYYGFAMKDLDSFDLHVEVAHPDIKEGMSRLRLHDEVPDHNENVEKSLGRRAGDGKTHPKSLELDIARAHLIPHIPAPRLPAVVKSFQKMDPSFWVETGLGKDPTVSATNDYQGLLLAFGMPFDGVGRLYLYVKAYRKVLKALDTLTTRGSGGRVAPDLSCRRRLSTS
ncbi:hypothetical protein QBC35DRAFT_452007 [Podospora australis]|uniref:Uncharacterized protein n=1 Tax=Podospora australis TaxID=1536484 RepID=A0AAN7AGH3_9PEZI|nr:hypothetical protein QBC35DRAFT_452007 [Podospora australis]